MLKPHYDGDFLCVQIKTHSQCLGVGGGENKINHRVCALCLSVVKGEGLEVGGWARKVKGIKNL